MSELPMTEPNSLFSKIMMAIYLKFGTSGFGVAVGEETEVEVRVGNGESVGKGVTVGAGGKVAGGTIGAHAQATTSINERKVSMGFVFIYGCASDYTTTNDPSTSPSGSRTGTAPYPPHSLRNYSHTYEFSKHISKIPLIIPYNSLLVRTGEQAPIDPRATIGKFTTEVSHP